MEITNLWFISVRSRDAFNDGKASLSRKRGFASISFLSSNSIIFLADFVSPYLDSCSFSLHKSNFNPEHITNSMANSTTSTVTCIFKTVGLHVHKHTMHKNCHPWTVLQKSLSYHLAWCEGHNGHSSFLTISMTPIGERRHHRKKLSKSKQDSREPLHVVSDSQT